MCSLSTVVFIPVQMAAVVHCDCKDGCGSGCGCAVSKAVLRPDPTVFIKCDAKCACAGKCKREAEWEKELKKVYDHWDKDREHLTREEVDLITSLKPDSTEPELPAFDVFLAYIKARITK